MGDVATIQCCSDTIFFIDRKLGGILELDYEAYIKEQFRRAVALPYLIPNMQHGYESVSKQSAQ